SSDKVGRAARARRQTPAGASGREASEAAARREGKEDSRRPPPGRAKNSASFPSLRRYNPSPHPSPKRRGEPEGLSPPLRFGEGAGGRGLAASIKPALPPARHCR